MIDAENRKRLSLDGYTFLQRWLPDCSTLDLARSIGTVVDVPSLLPGSGIPIIQTLKPRHRSESYQNQYSGTYGINDFPFTRI